MDIYILREGKEIGPFTEAKAHTLIRQGSIGIGDLSWRPGMSQWLPLSEVVPTLAAREPEPIETEAAAPELPSAEPATAKQRALLSYLGLTDPVPTKAQAALVISDAMEDPAHTVRFAQWQTDRFKLQPELFSAEQQARRENRAVHFLELAHTDGAAYFTKVTKAHAQVLISYLDVEFPNWDANEATAALNYFFPAVAEKFPQLVNPQWQGRLKYAAGPRVAPELGGSLTAAPQRPAGNGTSPLRAIGRGLFFGVLILAIAWFVRQVMTGGISLPTKTSGTTSVAPAAPSAPAPATSSEPPPTPTEPTAPQAPEPPKPSEPEMAAPAVANEPPPMAEKTSEPANSATPPSALAPPAAPPAPMTPLRLTKPCEVKLAFGKATLPPGTVVRFVSQEGPWVRVQYVRDTIVVPAGSTNLGELPPSGM